MDSLKRSMAWDERRFGREYDLDIFNIVAVSDFNFGAMENKGLNIFNDKLVFVKPDSRDRRRLLQCRARHRARVLPQLDGRPHHLPRLVPALPQGRADGLSRPGVHLRTSASRAVKRIDDVKTLRAAQFPEDGGPLAHPARPDRYKEINNFYTATVYEKGAEIVRMLATLLGEDGFRQRHGPLFRAPRRRGDDDRSLHQGVRGRQRRRPAAFPDLVSAGRHAGGHDHGQL